MGELVDFKTKELEKIKQKIEISEARKNLYLAYWSMASLVSPECMTAEMTRIRGRPIKILTRDDYERALESNQWAS
jgi:hypothetical protein